VERLDLGGAELPALHTLRGGFGTVSPTVLSDLRVLSLKSRPTNPFSKACNHLRVCELGIPCSPCRTVRDVTGTVRARNSGSLSSLPSQQLGVILGVFRIRRSSGSSPVRQMHPAAMWATEGRGSLRNSSMRIMAMFQQVSTPDKDNRPSRKMNPPVG